MRPDVIVLNDPARGIDVGAKGELYRHLRDFAGEGRSVVYLSSEIEEFVGFATRIIVFRDGAPFDAFDGRRLDARRVLEAMFGQTDGIGPPRRADRRCRTLALCRRETGCGFASRCRRRCGRLSRAEELPEPGPARAQAGTAAPRDPRRRVRRERPPHRPEPGMSALAAEPTTLAPQPAKAVHQQGGRSNPFLLMPITLFFALLSVAVLRSPSLMTSYGHRRGDHRGRRR